MHFFIMEISKEFSKHLLMLEEEKDKVKLNNEAQEYIWIKPEEALKLDLESYTKSFIKKYLKKKSF